MAKRFTVGDKVRVKSDVAVKDDPETEFYLNRFKNKVGELFHIHVSSKGIRSFEVHFEKEFGVFYENEIELVTTGK